MGGRFAFLSGRPYRWNHTQLQGNATAILTAWFKEPVNLVAVEDASAIARLTLEPARPNPSSGMITLHFLLPRAARAAGADGRGGPAHAHAGGRAAASRPARLRVGRPRRAREPRARWPLLGVDRIGRGDCGSQVGADEVGERGGAGPLRGAGTSRPPA